MLVPQAEPDAALLNQLVGLVADRTLEPVIDRRLPLDATPDAFGYLESTHTSGKVIIETP